MSFIRIDDVQELIAGTLDMSDLERDCFFAMGDDVWTVKELVEETGRSRSMVQRAVTALQEKDVVVREARTDRTVYYVYQRVPPEEVRDTVSRVLRSWHEDMQALLQE